MKTYYLKLKSSNEVISKSDFGSLELAIEYFSDVKKLDSDELLKIYLVTDSELK